MRKVLVIILLIIVLSIAIGVLLQKPAVEIKKELTALPEGYAVLFVTPDSGYYVVSTILSWANKTIDVMCYEFYHVRLFDILKEKAKQGIAVRVLLENNTYGEEGDRWNAAAAEILSEAGIDVRFDSLSGYLHAKVIIVDEEIVVVTSDNLMPSSYPTEPGVAQLSPYSKASRGWGIAIRNSTMAKELSNLFDSLFNSAIPFQPGLREAEAPPYYGEKEIPSDFSFEVVDLRGSRVALLVGENAYYAIKNLIESSSKSVLAELMYAVPGDDAIKLLLTELAEASEKGVSAKLLLEDDFPYYTYYTEVKRFFENTTVQVKPAFRNVTILFLHNKGLIVDGYAVVIGSHNWSYQSFFKNLEVSVIIENSEVAAFYMSCFEWDWSS